MGTGRHAGGGRGAGAGANTGSGLVSALGLGAGMGPATGPGLGPMPGRRRHPLRALAWLCAAAAIAGTAVPFFIPSYPPGARSDALTFARYAQAEARRMVDDPLRRLLAWQYQVTDVTRRSAEGACGREPYEAEGQYEGTVVVRTWMGLRLLTVTVSCRGATIQ